MTDHINISSGSDIEFVDVTTGIAHVEPSSYSPQVEETDSNIVDEDLHLIMTNDQIHSKSEASDFDVESIVESGTRDPEHTGSEVSQEYIERIFPYQENIINQLQERVVVLDRERKTLESLHEEQISNLTKEITRLNSSLTEQKTAFKQMETISGLSDSELVVLVQRKDREILCLNQQLDTFVKRFSEISNLQQDDRTRLDKLDSEERQLKLKEQSLALESALLTNKNILLTEEVDVKNKESIQLRSNLQREIDSLKEEVDCKLSLIEEIRDECQKNVDVKEELRQRLDKCLAQLSEERDELSQIEERSRKELSSHKKLAELYQKSAESSESRLKELLTGAEQLQSLNAQLTQRNLEQESRNEEQKNEFDSQTNDFKTELKSLQKELLHANELIEEMNVNKKGFYFTDKTQGNLTMTEIYSKYMTAEEQAKDLKDQNASLARNLELFKSKIDEKIPLVRRQKEENITLKQENNALKDGLTQSRIDIENLNSQYNLSIVRSRYLDKENKRLQETISNLKSQICILLKENEESRGVSVSTHYFEGKQAYNLNHTEVSSSSEPQVISFRSIEELQQRNMDLLSRVGELESNMEVQLNQNVDDKVADTQTRLNELMQTVQQIKESKRQQNEMLQHVVQERDKYKMFLAQNTPLPTGSGLMTAEWSDTSINNQMQTEPIPNTEDSVDTSAYKELQQTFNQYKAESEQLRKELMSDVSQLRDDKSSLSLESSRLCNKLEFATQRFELLKTAYESQRTENQLLKDKYDRAQKRFEELERTIKTLTTEQFSTREKLSYFDIHNESLQKKIESLKASEERDKQQIDNLLSEKRDQNFLKANLEAIQNTLDRSEQEAKARINQHINTLEEDLKYAKIQLENKDRQQEKLTDAWQTQIEELKLNLITAQKDHETSILLNKNQETNISELEAAIAKANEDGKKKELELAETIDSLKRAESGDMVVELKDEVSHLKFSLTEIQSEHKSLASKLLTAKEHAEQYKAIAEAIEFSLKEQNETMDVYRQDVENRLRATEESEYKLKTELEEIQSELNKQHQLNEELNSKHATLVKQKEEEMTYLKNQLDEAITTQVVMEEQVKQVKEDREIQAKCAKENQESYERELVQHGKCMEMYTQCKADVQILEEKLRTAHQLSNKHILLRTESTKQYEDTLTMHDSEISQLQLQIEDLKCQNTLLYSQLDTINAKLITMTHNNINTKLIDSAGNDNNVSEKGAPFSASLFFTQESESQLRELISILRREKEIAETKYELAETERIRLSEESTRVTHDLEQVKTVLESEQETLRAQTDTVAQHSKLLEKVNTLNILHESNKVLREEKNQFETKLAEADDKLREAKEEMITLKSSNSNLSSTKDILLAEKTALKQDISRWQHRVNKLLEKYDKIDPEEFNDLKQIKEAHESKIIDLENSVCKLKEAISNKSNSIENLQHEAEEMKAESLLKNEKHNSELEEVKKKATTTESELESTTTKMKKYASLARNYKNLSETNAKKIKQLEDKIAEEKGSVEQEKSKLMAEWQAKDTALTEEILSLTNTNTTLTEQLDQVNATVKEKEARINKLEELLRKATQRINKERTATTELESLKTDYHQLKSVIADKDTTNASKNEEYETKIESLEQKIQQLEQDLKSQVTSSNSVSSNIPSTQVTSSPSLAIVKPIIATPCQDAPPTVLITPFCASTIASSFISQPSTTFPPTRNIFLQSAHPSVIVPPVTSTTVPSLINCISASEDSAISESKSSVKRIRDDSDPSTTSLLPTSGENPNRKKPKINFTRTHLAQTISSINQQSMITSQQQQTISSILLGTPQTHPQSNPENYELASSVVDETPEMRLIDSTSTTNHPTSFEDLSNAPNNADIVIASDTLPMLNLPRAISVDSQSLSVPNFQLPISAAHLRPEMNHEVPNTPILGYVPPGLGHDIPYHVELNERNSPPLHPLIDVPDSSSLTDNTGEDYLTDQAELFSYNDQVPRSSNQEVNLVSRSTRIRSADDDSVSPSISHRVPSTSDSPTSTPGPLVSTSSQSHHILTSHQESNSSEANEAAVHVTTPSNLPIELTNLQHQPDETDTNNEVEFVIQSELMIDIIDPEVSIGPEQSAGVTSLEGDPEINVEGSDGEDSSTADDETFQDPIIVSSPGSCNDDDDDNDAECNIEITTGEEIIPASEDGEITTIDEQQEQIELQSINSSNDNINHQQYIEQTIATSSIRYKHKGSSIVPIVWDDKQQQQQQQQQQASSSSSNTTTTTTTQSSVATRTSRRRANQLANIQVKSKKSTNTQ